VLQKEYAVLVPHVALFLYYMYKINIMDTLNQSKKDKNF